MTYCKFLDSLPHLAKILFAIFLNPLFVVQRFITDITEKNYGLVVWDALLGVAIHPFFWICNIVWTSSKDKIFSFADFFGNDGGIHFEATNSADPGTSIANAQEVKVEDKADTTKEETK